MATQIPNNLFSHKTCLSNEDLDTLYQIYDGVISRQFIGQVAKAHNFSANSVEKYLGGYVERQLKQNQQKPPIINANAKKPQPLKQKDVRHDKKPPRLRKPDTPNPTPVINSDANKSLNNNNIKFADIASKQPRSTGAVPKKPQPPRKSAVEIQYEKIIDLIRAGIKVVVILRGPPGCGKTFLADQIFKTTVGIIQDTHRDNHIFSADSFFYKGKHYQFDQMLLPKAHERCQNLYRDAVRKGVSPVIVDNTNIKYWEMQPYVVEALKNGYYIKMIVPNTPWARSASQLTGKCLHNVPRSTIERHLEQFDPIVNEHQLINIFNLDYPRGMTLPQIRNYPPITNNAAPEFSSLKHYEDSKKIKADNKVKDEEIPSIIEDNNSINELTKPLDERKNSDQIKRYTRAELLEIVPVIDRERLRKNIYGDLYNQPKPQRKNKRTQSHSSHEDDRSEGNANTEIEESGPLIDWTEQLIGNQDEKISCTTSQPEVSGPQNPRNSELLFSLLDEPITENNLPFVNLSLPIPPSAPDSDTLSNKSATSETLEPSKPDQNYPRKDTFLGSFKTFFSLLNNIQKDDKPKSTLPTSVTLGNLLTTTYNTGTSTCYNDFNIAANINQLPFTNPSSDEYQRIIIAENRNINENYIPSNDNSPPLKLKLDKGCMTEVEEEEEVNLADGLQELCGIFPDIPKKDLRHILEQCQGQVHWAVDILLDSPELDMPNRQEIDDDEPDPSAMNEEESEDEQEEAMNICEPDEVVTSPHCFTRSPADLEEKLKLKKQLEQQIVIGDNHYSEHCLKIRNFRHPEAPKIEDEESSSSDSEDTREENEEIDDCIELPVGFEFIECLNKAINSTNNTPFPDGLKPVINVPKSLAQQLHSLWLESYYQQVSSHEEQLETMFKEDEEFARQLQEKENELNAAGAVPNVASMQDLMNMEIDLEIAKRVQYDQLTDDPIKYQDLATRMTQHKLFEMFPNIEKDTICGILEAFDNRYDQTVALIRNDLSQDGGAIAEDGDAVVKEKNLLEEARRVSSKLNDITSDSRNSLQSQDNQTAEYYRDIAQKEIQRRNECIEKARNMYTRGLTSVAAYYSELAQVHKNKFEYANHCAATCFVNGQTTQKNACNSDGTLLDLHFLFVPEAIQILDIFIDNHLEKLHKTGKKSIHLYLITGRGSRSAGGKARIKPATISRLRKRNLNATVMNPGLLRFKLHHYDKTTTELPSKSGN